MTLREKILQTFVVTIHEINTHGGIDEFFAKYPVGGLYYLNNVGPFDENGLEIGSGMKFETFEKCKAASRVPLFTCADLAGMKGQSVFAGAGSLGASESEEDAYALGKIVGMQMNANGIDWVLGPTVDLFYNRSMPLFATTDDTDLTIRLYKSYIKGVQDQGVCATAKHFPGLGTCNVNMHFGPGQNVLPFDEWMDSYGRIYKELSAEGVFSVMTTHVTLRSFDNKINGEYYPIATYSHKLTTELLKEKLGFGGAVVTDALIMGGMATGDIIEETAEAFKAGADFLLWPPIEAAERIEEKINSGEIPMSRLDDALERINKLRSFRENALRDHSYDEPDLDFIDTKSAAITKSGMCMLRNDIGLLPLDRDKYKKILIVDVTGEEDKGSSALLAAELKKYGAVVDVKRDIYDVPSRVCWQKDVDALQAEYDLVIFNVNMVYATTWSVPFMLIWASHLFDKKKKLIINYGSPFFAPDYFPQDPTYIEVNANPSENSIKDVAAGIYGKMEFTGRSLLKHELPGA